jgi:hypothetical protein
MNQQPLWSGPGQTPNPQKTPHLYSWRLLRVLVFLYIISFILVGVGSRGTIGAGQNWVSAFLYVLGIVGSMLLLGIHVIVIIIDGRNFFTLNGNIQWQRMKKGWRIALICVYCCFWIMSAIYLAMAVKLAIEARQQRRASKSYIHMGNNMNQQAQVQSQVGYTPHPVPMPLLAQPAMPHVLQSPGISQSQETHPNKPAQGQVQSAGVAPVSQDRISPPIPPKEEKKAVKVFFCYAHEDRNLRDQLDKHLSPLKHLGQIISWYDKDLQAGTEWEKEIDKHITISNIILLLVSPDFMSSDYCYSVEMQKALAMHKARRACVIPIILRPVDWESTLIKTLQVLPPDGKPITTWSNRDKAFAEVAQGIRAVVETFLDPPQQYNI